MMRVRCWLLLGGLAARTVLAQNVVLISVDTLRFDHLPAYGYTRVSTPAIDSLARRGARFDTCIASVPLTLPSHCSILTGKYPPHHGVRDNGGYYLPPSERTMAEMLHEGGYETGAFVGAYVLDGRFGLNQGFDYYFDEFDLSSYENQAFDAIQRPGGEVMDRALKWIDARGAKKFFAFIHLYDPHSPYEAPEPYVSRYRGQQYGLYDAEIAYVDSQIGLLVERLGSRLDSTTIVFTSDHGEGLGDHGEGAHGYFVYDSTIRVPLIVVSKNVRPGTVVSDLVRTVDLLPTVVELAGIAPPDGIDGKSLLPLLAGHPDHRRIAYAESLYPQLHYRWAALRCARILTEKYVQTTRPESYDLTVDPGEVRSVFTGAPPPAMKAYLDEVSTKELPASRVSTDPETLDALRALGYASAPLPSSEAAPLPDPKDKLPLFNLLRLASDDSLKKDYGAALQKVGAVLKQDPAVTEAHLLAGNINFKQGALEISLRHYESALALEPNFLPGLFGAGLAQKALGRRSAAEATFHALHRLDPQNPRALFLLGELAAEGDRLDDALAFFRDALAVGSDEAQTHKRLGECLLGLGRLREAADEYDAARKIRPGLPGLHYDLALLAEAQQDDGTALDEYQQELRASPEHAESLFNLGVLLLKRGRPAEALPHLRSCASARPGWGQARVLLAKSIADSGGNLVEAEATAREGLAKSDDPDVQRLAHLVLADILVAMGRKAEAERELEAARALSGR